ncbi:hypothetical protein LTR36_001417 [Oleoguttula mirabilis]|uniref:DNA 3'-5' helicase n=1 Tax=Oleoguttula mirabilis TaxID=1507867 RepID=A0AAV9JPH5_9PEZI|nr:hypothetical protein LTR36_001417 [Oleoguttula mirabilis]
MDGDLLHGLNGAQCDAVTSQAAVLQVLAPPGSGKTKTLTARVAYLIAHQQLKPWNIIVCTFTVKAASEMKERITGFVGAEVAKQLKLGTFHSISLRYLKQYGQHIGLDKDFGIADSSDSKAIVKRIIKQHDLTIDAGQARNRISTQKAKGIDSEQFLSSAKKIEQQEFATVYREYEATLKASNLLDYDDLLLRCGFLLRKHPQCVSNVEALLIDEFQDTNNIQYDLMALFAQRQNVITIVGDPDQSIYGFRCAEIKNLSRMKQQWPDTFTINLEENYRSSGAILNAAQRIIEQDESRPPKSLQATHSPGMRPILRKLPSATGEARWLVSEVQRIQAMTGGLLQPGDFAVLLRSAALSRTIESALNKAEVPYRMIGGTRFYDRAEVKLIIDYLRVINNPANSEAVERIVNVPARRVGEGTVKSLHEEARSEGVSLWSLVLDTVQGRCKPKTKVTDATHKGLAVFVNVILTCQRKVLDSKTEPIALVDLMNTVLKKLCFEAYLKKKYAEEYEARWANIEELIAQATEASDPERLRAMLQEDALPAIDGLEQRTASSTEDMLSMFLASTALAASSEEKPEEEGRKVQQLTISTIHAAKGLEWPVVFIPACYDGSLPHSRADDNDEERRLLYVGMTRAQALLYLSCPIKNTQREETTLSTFLIQPGVTGFFEEHGPSITLHGVTGLATTLRRDCPQKATIDEAKRKIERDEDSYWPLNGEEPVEEVAKWDHGKGSGMLPAFGTTRPAAGFTSAAVTMQQGFSTASATIKPEFISANARFEELREQAQLKKVDHRVQQTNNKLDGKPKGGKRQIEGQGSIAGFFAKRSKPEQVLEAHERDAVAFSSVRPLQEVRNLPAESRPKMAEPRIMDFTKHKPRNAPLHGKPNTVTHHMHKADNRYVFLDSSPPQAETDENQTSDTVPTSDVVEVETSQTKVRPASTFHTTTVQTAAPQRKTYGVRRSMNGWSNRGGKTR